MFIQVIFSNDFFKLFIQIIFSNNSFKLFIQIIFSNDFFKLFIQIEEEDDENGACAKNNGQTMTGKKRGGLVFDPFTHS